MRTFLKKTMWLSMMFLVSALAPQAYAATSVGKAIISIGKVVAISKEGKEKKLKRRGKVYEGDTIKVGGKSRLQLRFVDNQLVVLKENTVFRIDEYKFSGKKDQNKSAALSLLKGGMRSVTGLIGKSARDKYKVKTPVATMGVRGTHYVLHICNNDCGGGAGGLVGTVLEGEIEMTNDAGSAVFGTDQFFSVASLDDAPASITNPPATLISSTETEPGEEEGGGAVALEGGGEEPTDETTPDGFSPSDGSMTTDIVFTSGEETNVETTKGGVTQAVLYTGIAAPFGAAAAFSQISDGVNGASRASGVQGFNANINLETADGVANQLVNTSITDVNGTLSFQVLDSEAATELGGDAEFGINWGRWDSVDVVFTDATGTEQELRTGLSFVYSDNLAPDLSTLAGLGVQVYDFLGGPNILDESGGILVEDNNAPLFLAVNFTAQQVIAFGGNLIGQDGRSYLILTPGGPVSFSALQAGASINISATCLGGAICASGIPLNGTANGVFIGSFAERFIGAFGLSNTSGTIAISGTGAFERGPGGQ